MAAAVFRGHVPDSHGHANGGVAMPPGPKVQTHGTGEISLPRRLGRNVPGGPAKFGQFPQDVRPRGCYEVAGNVSEWGATAPGTVRFGRSRR